MQELKKKDSESKFEYIKRLVYGKLKDKTIDNDYVEIAPYLFGVELSSCECRKRMYGVLNILEQLEGEVLSNVTDEQLLDELTMKTLELKKERQKNQTINAQINKNLRRVARNEMTQDLIIEAIEKLEPLTFPKPIITRENPIQEGILPISDIHFGKECVIRGLKGEIINEYNEEVYKRRMNVLLEEAIRIAKKEQLGKLNILLTGDLIDGILRMTQLQKIQYGIIDSTMRLAEHLSAWLNELSKYVKLDLYFCLGNHSQIRPLGSSNGEFAEENMEKIIIWYLKSRLESNSNINLIENDSDFIYFNCLGLNIMASHGEEKNLESAIKDYMLLYGEKIDLFIGGHLHTKENKSIGINNTGLSDIEYCRVKSICSIDDYSTKLRRSSGAGTSLFIIEQNKGKTITYDINLQ